MDKYSESCELLSFFSIFGIQNNQFFYFVQIFAVVNCFHFSVSLGYKTTVLGFYAPANSLWIALATPNRLAFPLLDFIFQYLWDTKQQIKFLALILVSCELLSFFSIFGIQNNNASGKVKSSVVVNCFHFSVSLGYKTTFVKFLRKFLVLWIAFIFQYLWDTKQPCNQLQVILVRCELLSFFSIFGIQNN